MPRLNILDEEGREIFDLDYQTPNRIVTVDCRERYEIVTDFVPMASEDYYLLYVVHKVMNGGEENQRPRFISLHKGREVAFDNAQYLSDCANGNYLLNKDTKLELRDVPYTRYTANDLHLNEVIAIRVSAVRCDATRIWKF